MLIFNDEMYQFLQFAQRDSIIAALFLQGDSSHINDEGNYIKRVDDEIDVVSFLPKSKYEKVEDNWENGRVKIKIGRFVRKFLTEFSFKNFKITDSTLVPVAIVCALPSTPFAKDTIDVPVKETSVKEPFE